MRSGRVVNLYSFLLISDLCGPVQPFVGEAIPGWVVLDSVRNQAEQVSKQLCPLHQLLDTGS